MIELVIAIPILVALMWGIVQILLYAVAVNTLHNAAQDAASLITEQLRGYDGTLDGNPNYANMAATVSQKIQNATHFNALILVPQSTPVSIENDCSTMDAPAICMYTVTNNVDGNSLREVEVTVRGHFHVAGTFVPAWLSDKLTINASGIAPEDLPNRFNYYTP